MAAAGVRERIGRIASWPIVAVLVVVVLACIRGFAWRRQRLGHPNQLLDGRRWYTPDDVQHLFRSLGTEGARLYAVTEVTLDVLFPIAYGLLVAIVLARLYRADWLPLVPLSAAAVDVLENVAIAYLAWTYGPHRSVPVALAVLAAVCTATKSALILASLALVIVGGVKELGRWLVGGWVDRTR